LWRSPDDQVWIPPHHCWRRRIEDTVDAGNAQEALPALIIRDLRFVMRDVIVMQLRIESRSITNHES